MPGVPSIVQPLRPKSGAWQRVQNITAEDCIAEGLSTTLREHDACCDLADQFRGLWDSINAKRGFGWDANPWVWALTFKRVEQPA